MSGQEGDQFLSQKDAIEWVHDGTNWQLRPFAPRQIAEATIHHGVFRTSDDPWTTKLPGASCAFRKSHAQTTLIVRGWVGAYMVDNEESTWIAAHVVGTPALAGGNPPPANTIAGFWLRHGHVAATHDLMPFHAEITGVAAGDGTVEILVGTKYGYVATDANDMTRIIVEESYP